jgi:hypothetical protein
MKWWLFVALLFGVGVLAVAVTQQAGSTDTTAKGVARQYAGNWVCQTAMPGYNLLPYGADMSQPMTNRLTTPGSVAVMKFSLRPDGTYDAPNAKGRYSLDPATKTVTWLDGPYKKALTETKAEKRKDGAPSLGFVMNGRYYGCFMADRRAPAR